MKERVLPQNWGVLGDSLAVKANGWRMPESDTGDSVLPRGRGPGREAAVVLGAMKVAFQMLF